ncbi:protein peste-like [Coccinella septempunctata]|uniref:protein peste-like n=1 Tax=Coccinella septempunctata TaxID=41139 RepID=UPI001D080CEE|nr:protein peste-like [Coccinella septempunctata]XP_044754721.1 protein peste-like [Coccinella septempunctata]
MKVKKYRCGLTAVSLSFIIVGATLAISSIKIYDVILKKVLDLTPGGILYKEWIKPPPSMTFDIYFFNWTNPEDFYNKSTKPIVTEVGPFRFDMLPERSNVTFNPSNDTLTYDLRRWYRFNEAESPFGLDTKVTILNQLSAAAAYKSQEMNFIMKASVSVSISSMTEVYMTRSVRELLFEGSQETMLDVFRKFPFGVSKDDIPERFGYFFGKNGSSDGTFNIGTGHGDKKLGMLFNWNGQNYTRFYGDSCNTVEGASADFFTDNIEKKTIFIYNPELCRRFPLDFVGKSTVHGIEGYRFEVGASLLDNGSTIAGNECFCADQCMRNGVFPATLCKGHANNFLSLPHFHKADPYYASLVEGMKPDPKKHNFYLVVEPTTGILLKMEARLQMSIFVTQFPSISMFREAPTLLFPIMRFQNSVKIPEVGAFSLGILLSLKGVVICIGSILVLIGTLIYLIFVFELGRKKDLIHEEDRYCLPEEINPLKEKQKEI